MTAPTIATLRNRLGVDEPKAKRLRALMTGAADPREHGNVQRWLDQCYNEPRAPELIMCAIDEELETHGVEPIRGRHVDNYHFDIQAVYCNTGDTYGATVLLDHETGNYHATTWGDWFEANEKRRELS